MLKVNMIYISSKFLVDELKYSQNVFERFMASFLFFAPLLKCPASFVGHSVDIDSCIKIARYRSENCLLKRCKKPYVVLIEKLEKYKKDLKC